MPDHTQWLGTPETKCASKELGSGKMFAIDSNLSDQPTSGRDSSGSRESTENEAIATLLREISTLLAHQGASEFRVRAYANAGRTLIELDKPVRDLLDHEGVEGLIALPTIGHSIAHVVEQYLRLGQIPLLDHLRGEDAAERVFATLPSIGPELSRRIHEYLEIETLPELQAAVEDGRLESVPGIGKKRVDAIRECLASRLRRTSDQPRSRFSSEAPAADPVPVGELLDVDLEYRRSAAMGKLTKIAPRRFNPDHAAWLPILHTHRSKRHYTAMYSNSIRAHQLNTTMDWVVIYRDDPQSHGRWTVITSQFGELRGWRIVRGRENECAEYYIHNRQRDA